MGHYEELGVPPSASPAEVRRAYLALARVHHPDRLTGAPGLERAQGAARMARINEAWSVLSDPRRRARYDEALGEAVATPRVHQADATFTPFHEGADPDPMDLDDTPIGPPTLSRRVTMVPAWLAILAFVALVLGGLVGIGVLFVAGLALVVLSGVSFLLLPLVALARSARREEL